ncbi:MAG: DUF6057 family protein [Bacteroidia bacterium]|nr:DUF6057 family protein [Bacteroidia bacterium]
MNNSSHSFWVSPIFLSLSLFLAVLLFFGLMYPHHLHFQEQYQLFLFDWHYALEVLSIPGGLADLLGRFFTQFFLLAWVGATILAFLITTIFLLTYKITPKGWLASLSLLPSIALWAFMCDENGLLGGVIAVLFALVFAAFIPSIKHQPTSLASMVISAPILYWAIGPVAIITPLIWLLSSLRSHSPHGIKASLFSMAIISIMPILAQHMVALPLERLFSSPHYYRNISTFPQLLWFSVAIIAILPILPKLSPNSWLPISTPILTIFVGGLTIHTSYNAASEEVMSYDFMCRFQQWNRIVNRANTKKPKNALSCTALNLALGMRGELADRLFEYNQNGTAGLIPDFNRDPISPLTTSEVYLHLGMVNTVQRLVFEAQESIQDCQKSARCYKRLAETNLLSGNYAVAEKYLSALTKTIFYRDFAHNTLSLLYNEEAITNHNTYGHLRSIMPKADCMFQQGNLSELLAQQLSANSSNRLAYEYLQCANLLMRDLNSFVSSLDLGKDISYQRMPFMFQQAYILWFSQNHNPNDKIPDFINPQFITGLNQFFNMARQKNINRAMLNASFGNTYWNYYIAQ